MHFNNVDNQATLGNYTKAEVCKPCGWFQLPAIVDGLPSVQYQVCPSCGGEVEAKVGRYRYKERKSFWFGNKKTFLDFELKLKRTSPPLKQSSKLII